MGPVVTLYHKEAGAMEVPEWQAQDVLRDFPHEWAANPWPEEFRASASVTDEVPAPRRGRPRKDEDGNGAISNGIT